MVLDGLPYWRFPMATLFLSEQEAQAVFSFNTQKELDEQFARAVSVRKAQKMTPVGDHGLMVGDLVFINKPFTVAGDEVEFFDYDSGQDKWSDLLYGEPTYYSMAVIYGKIWTFAPNVKIRDLDLYEEIEDRLMGR